MGKTIPKFLWLEQRLSLRSVLMLRRNEALPRWLDRVQLSWLVPLLYPIACSINETGAEARRTYRIPPSVYATSDPYMVAACDG
jgi:hypothetical protein